MTFGATLGRCAGWIGAMALVAAAGIVLQQRAAADIAAQFAHLGAPIPVAISTTNGFTIVAVLCGEAAVLAFCSWGFARTLRGVDARRAVYLALAAAFIVGIVLSAGTVLLSSDVYAYVMYGRLHGVWGLNPYHRQLLNPAMDPMIRFALVVYGNPPHLDAYGPLWTLLVAALARLEAHVSLVANIWTQRALALAAVLAAIPAIARLSAAWDARGAPSRTALFATHPLVLYESATGGHNDMIMVAFAVWAFALAETWPILAGALLGASVAIKYATVIIAPFFFIKLFRRNWKTALGSFGLAVAVFAICLLPFFGAGKATLPAPRTDIGFSAVGLAYLIATAWAAVTNAVATHWIILAFGGLFVLALILAMLAFARRGERGALWAAAIAAIWSLPTVFTWYVQWLLPMVADRGRFAAYAWWLGIFVFLQYFFVVPKEVSVSTLVVLAFVIIIAPVVLARMLPPETTTA